MVGMLVGVYLYTFRAEETEADPLGAEVCDGFFWMLGAWDVMAEIGLHVV